jgi:hypothetical protein
MNDKRKGDGVPTRDDASDFLTSIKLAIEYGCCQFIGRPRTEQDLSDLNLTRSGAFEIICLLTPDCYVSGPMPDNTDPGKDVWVFGCDHEGGEVYIKLRLNPTRGGEMPRAAVWSFHKAAHPMRYPLRRGGA